MNPLEHSNNLAARMGRWSASHKKTAIFGWLAFVAVAFMIGNAIGTKQLDPNKTGTGESGHVDSVLARRVQAGSGRPDPDPEHDQDGRRSGLPGGDHRRRPDGRRHDAGEEGRVAVRGRQRGADLQATATRRSSRSSFARPTLKKATKLDKPVEKAIIAADARHPGIAIEEFGVNVETQLDKAVVSDFKKAGAVLAAGHADRPGHRLRRADRRGPAAAARADGGVRDDGTARAPEPADPARPGHQRDRAADRARGRRRLLALLPEARARGARRRPQRAGRARGRRRDLRPLGAHLRPDRDGRDGRDALHRRQDVHGLRRRDDDRRRDRRARLADRPAGDCSPRSATRSTSCASRSCTGAAARRAAAGSGARSSIASCAARSSRSSSPAGSCSRSPHRRCTCTSPSPASRRFPQNLSSIKTYNKLQKAFPGEANSAQVLVKTDDARSPGGHGRDRRPEAPGDRDRAVLHPDARRLLRRRHDRASSRSRCRATASTTRR